LQRHSGQGISRSDAGLRGFKMAAQQNVLGREDRRTEVFREIKWTEVDTKKKAKNKSLLIKDLQKGGGLSYAPPRVFVVKIITQTLNGERNTKKAHFHFLPELVDERGKS